MTGGDFPYAEKQEGEIYAHVVNEKRRLPRPAEAPDLLWSIVQRCWAENAGERPTFEQLGEEFERQRVAEERQSLLHDAERRVEAERAEAQRRLEAERAERAEAQRTLEAGRVEAERRFEAERAERAEAERRFEAERAEAQRRFEAERVEAQRTFEAERAERAETQRRLEAELERVRREAQEGMRLAEERGRREREEAERRVQSLVDIGASPDRAAALLSQHGSVEAAADAFIAEGQTRRVVERPAESAVQSFFRKVRSSEADVAEATQLDWIGKGLDDEDCKVIAWLVSSGALDTLKVKETHLNHAHTSLFPQTYFSPQHKQPTLSPYRCTDPLCQQQPVHFDWQDRDRERGPRSINLLPCVIKKRTRTRRRITSAM